MARPRRLGRLACLAACTAAPAFAQDQPHSEVGGGPLGVAGGAPLNCITPAQELEALQQIEAFLETDAARELAARGGGAGDVLPFEFYPQAGNLYADLYHNNFVDLGVGSTLLDFACTDHTYDGHRGHDSDLRSFDEQAIGVPVYAVAEGTVVARHDGEFDRQVEWNANNQANYVILDHGGGVRTWYWHLRNGSVGLGVGDRIRKGQHIGYTASSGYSTGPHLHFETRIDNVPVEPNAGPCEPGDSHWETPWGIRRDTYVREFQFVQADIEEVYSFPPYEYPRSRYATLDGGLISYVLQGQNLPEGTTWRSRFLRPDGTVAYDSGDRALSWATRDLRWWWMYFRYYNTVPEMRTTPGDWTFQVYLNGVREIDTQIRVIPETRGGMNRPPAAVAPVLDPVSPEADDAIFCRIFPDLIHDDPDFDVVRYRYRWFVDGEMVRDVTLASHSDAIPQGLAPPNARVRCEVTPSDGELSATAAQTETVIVGLPDCYCDLTGDNRVNSADLSVLLAEWGASAVDFDADGVTTTNDLGLLLSTWGDCE